VWGTGEQIRNWTHVDDIVEGTILAAERIDKATAVNLGTTERIRVIDCAREVIRLAGYDAEIKTVPDKPTGPLNRVLARSRQSGRSSGALRHRWLLSGSAFAVGIRRSDGPVSPLSFRSSRGASSAGEREVEQGEKASC
jgi:hypothetical protein